jgi:integrase
LATPKHTVSVAKALPRELMMVRRNLTDRKVNSLKRNTELEDKLGHYDTWDTVLPGLGVRVSKTGRRTFVLMARYPGSKNPTRRALGTYGELTLEQARAKARKWLALIEQGKDPQIEDERLRASEQRKLASTFAAVAEDFIRDKLSAERRGRDAERDIRREFLPALGGRPIADITPFDIVRIVKAVKDRGTPYQAHNLLGTARRLFSWAIDQHAYGLETSPCDRLKPKSIIGAKVARSRVLDDSEIRALWRATETIPYPYGPLFRVLALTGQRKSEVAEARWSEFDLGRKLWGIPAERMKADAPHVVPLSNEVIEILKTLPRFERGDYLFSTTSGSSPVNSFGKGKARLDKAMAAALGREVAPFVIHDIRRTMRTGLSALPVPDLVRELVIAHTKPGLHKVYDQHAYLDEKRHALELWARRLRDIVTPPPANVVELAGAWQ